MFTRIKALREDNDYSQEYISKLLGCSRSNYAMYESGDVKINVEQLFKLALIYNTSIDYLVGLTDTKFIKAQICVYEKDNLKNNIKKLRKERRIHQSFLALQVLRCTQATYSQYETGKRSVNVDVIIALAKFYKVSVDFLVGRIETPMMY